MARRLSVKHRKNGARDKATAFLKGLTPKRCKVADGRSRKALLKKAHPST